MIEEIDGTGEYDTARRYDEVVDMGEDSGLEGEVLDMGEIVGQPRNNDLQEHLEVKPEIDQSEKQSVKSESVPKQDEEFQQVLQKFEASDVEVEVKCATSQSSNDPRHN